MLPVAAVGALSIKLRRRCVTKAQPLTYEPSPAARTGAHAVVGHPGPHEAVGHKEGGCFHCGGIKGIAGSLQLVCEDLKLSGGQPDKGRLAGLHALLAQRHPWVLPRCGSSSSRLLERLPLRGERGQEKEPPEERGW